MVSRTADADINRAPAPVLSEPSLGTLFAEMTDQVSVLMRREVELARVETEEKIATTVKSAVSMIRGGLIAYAGLIVLLLGAAYGLAQVIDLWIATLIVGIITLIIGGLMFMAGRRAMSEVNFVPENTIKSVQNSMDMIKEKVNE